MGVNYEEADRALSSFWRVKRSSDRAVELRDLQDHLTYLARLVTGEGSLKVGWKNEGIQTLNRYSGAIETRYSDTLVLDSSPVDDLPLGSPVPDERVDVLFGDVLYRASLERIKRSGYVRSAEAYWQHQERAAIYLDDDGKIKPLFKSSRWIDRPVRTIDIGYDPTLHRPIHVVNPIRDLTKKDIEAIDLPQVMDVLEHIVAFTESRTAPPAVGEYVETSRKWKRDLAQPLIDSLVEKARQEEITAKDALDIWAVKMTYGFDLPRDCNLKLATAILRATQQVLFLLQADHKPRVDEVLSLIRQLVETFKVFPKRIQPPSQPTPEPSDEDDEESEDSAGEQTGNSGSQSDESEDSSKNSSHSSQDSQTGSSSSGDDSDEDDADEGDSESGGSSSPKDSDDLGDEDSEPEDSSDGGGDQQSGQDHDSDGEDEGTDESEGGPQGSTSGSGLSSDDADGDSPDEDFGEEGDEDWDSDGNDEEDDSSEPGRNAQSKLSGANSKAPKKSPLVKALEKAAQEKSVLDALDLMSELSAGDLEQIEEAVEKQREDLTQELEKAGVLPPGGAASGANVFWQKEGYSQPLEATLRTDAYQQATGLASILRRFNRMRSRYEHGRPDGYKVDGRRLGRVLSGNLNVFQKRTIIDKLDMHLTLLLDSSGSMLDEQWYTMTQVAACFAQAFGIRDDVDLMCMSYTSFYDQRLRRGGVHLGRLFDSKLGRFHGVRTYDGGTPSALAFAAIRESIYKRLKVKRHDKIIIHLTDGAPDNNATLKEQVALCRKAGIDVYCLLIEGGYSYGGGHEAFIDAYGESRFIHLNDFKLLTRTLTELFGKITEIR